MDLHPSGNIAVIFCAQRTRTDDEAYTAAAEIMSNLAAQQSGYLGQDSSRSEDGLGITVSYWKDDEAAKAWRDHPVHSAIREQGRGKWYESYTLHVAKIERSYSWQKTKDSEKSGIGKNSVP
ncbi:antibiotic biosynthesis monooxygenase family protein [Parasphingorhabdus cellanae]|uniref:Antibiotic biosynthesis monooxygenase n=1 Tax=Parasphingorhabdus cellanae TaxID=2806553 RepID=A0ABX7T7E5_9SPHN|nr:antibiotic biosynthesis monooxygenase [Parasphingorhabdus cellanae]QTD57041.1 antibiotic biosynthesis monooxygenase [Parasphingorhabdus cellanae]